MRRLGERKRTGPLSQRARCKVVQGAALCSKVCSEGGLALQRRRLRNPAKVPKQCSKRAQDASKNEAAKGHAVAQQLKGIVHEPR